MGSDNGVDNDEEEKEEDDDDDFGLLYGGGFNMSLRLEKLFDDDDVILFFPVRQTSKTTREKIELSRKEEENGEYV